MDRFSEQELFYKLDNMVLASCLHLRNLFKNRWKLQTGESWSDERATRTKLIERLTPTDSKSKKCPLPKYQQEAVINKSIVEWDMTLLSAVLQLFKNGDNEKDVKENEAIRKLKEIRNTLAHDDIGKSLDTKTEEEQCNRKCTQNEFKMHSATFKESMQCLGMAESDIDIIIEKSGVTSSLKAQDRVKALHIQAKDLVTLGNFEDAIQIYNEAILTPSLLPVDRGVAYEKRAECYLVLIKNLISDQTKIAQALHDANEALELNCSSWKAHFLEAKCFRFQNKLSEALQSYEDALVISPNQQQVKRDMDSCKVLAGIQSREEHLDPMFLPMNLQERVERFENDTGFKLTDGGFLLLNTKIVGKYFPGQDHVFRGHQYFSGWGVKQDFAEAAKYYTKADNLGNPEGSYNLGQCYYHGKGVNQDVEKALKICKRVAEMDRNILGECTATGCNLGVAFAQHAIGLMYENDVGIERNYGEAAKWYERAMENGVGMAANNLGILCSNGHGIDVDEEKAEMCWKRAMELLDINAPVNLIKFYIDQFEPEKASLMLSRGKELGNNTLKYITDQEFDRMVEYCVAERIRGEDMVKGFESTYDLNGEALTFKQRISRAIKQVAPNIQAMRDVAENTERVSSGLGSKNKEWAGKSQIMTDEMIDSLERKAWEGSEIAKEILEGLEYNIKVNEALETTIGDFSEEKKLKIVDILYKIAIQDTTNLYFKSDESEERLKEIFAELFHKKCEEKGEYDMKIRLCHCVFNLGGSRYCENDTFVIKLLKEGISRYPENVSYHDRLICILAQRQEYEEGLSYVNQATGRFPENADLLYCRAFIINSLERFPTSEMLKAYKVFFDVAPREHRKVPEAFYRMSSISIRNFHENRTKENWKIMKSFFEEGIKAEDDQLACYPPYGETDTKKFMSWFLSNDMGILKPPASFPKAKPLSVLEKKPYLKNPARQSIIRQHREILQLVNALTKTKVKVGIPPKFKQTPAKTFSALKPITLEEMNPNKDHIYENRVLEVLIICEPNCHHLGSISLIVQDGGSDITNLHIHNIKWNMETIAKFQPGCRLAIINPYMQKGSTGINQGIRNDESQFILHLQKVENMGRFCGEEGATLKCSNCKRPYCSRKCQQYDWSKMNHKVLCSLKCNNFQSTS